MSFDKFNLKANKLSLIEQEMPILNNDKTITNV